jgi:DNA-directed RNA polymerase subunit RPC12/RpoP
MKLTKLTKNIDGQYEPAEVPEKINEIIDFLNGSFITQDHDCVTIGELVNLTEVFTDEDFKMADSHCKVETPITTGHTSISTDTYIACDNLRLTCDRLQPFDNECVTLQAIQDNNVYEPQGLYDDISCPHCGEKYFTVGASMITAIYYPPIYKDGININPDKNTTTTTYHCLACNKDWTE